MAKDKAKAKEEEKDEKDEGAKKTDKAKEGDAAAPEEGAEGEAPKKSKKKIIIIGVLALVVIIGGVAGAYFAGLFGGHSEGPAEGASAEIAKPVFYTMPEFLINLNTSGKSASFLKTTIILEVAKQEDVPLIEANLPRVVDTVNTYLRELRASDLSGSAGIQRLREELMTRSNKVLAPVKINDVLFKEIVIQ